MKHTSPTILALAAIAAVPSAYALDVKDDDVKLGIGVQIQARAEYSQAETAAGGDYDPHTSISNGGDPVDFSLRRVRFTMRGSWKNDYLFNLAFQADDAGRSSTRPDAQLYEAFIGRRWKSDDISHTLQAGLVRAFFNGVTKTFSSAEYLFPGVRATDGLLKARGVGVGYLLSSPIATFGVDVQNNTGDAEADRDGMFYSARLELTPPGELGIAKATESFIGKDGKGVWMSLDYGTNVRDGASTTPITTTSYGVELLGHLDGLTALAEFRTQAVENMNTNVETKHEIWLVQAGYALPLFDGIIEPAIRYQSIDRNTDNDKEGASYGKDDFGNSGTQIDVGVNYYIHGHKNKVQVAYSAWTGEENSAGDEASANIYRVQWQLTF